MTSNMPPPARRADVCIVGAGLSGAYAASLLESSSRSVVESIAVLDARSRVGGRLYTNVVDTATNTSDNETIGPITAKGGEKDVHGRAGDLGAAWVWPASEKTMANFMRLSGVPTVNMYDEGDVRVQTPQNSEPHKIDAQEYGGVPTDFAACGAGAIRIKGGADTMVHRLLGTDMFAVPVLKTNANTGSYGSPPPIEEAAGVCEDSTISSVIQVSLGVRVESITYDALDGKVENDGGTEYTNNIDDASGMIRVAYSHVNNNESPSIIECRAVILAAPPKVLVHTIEFDPALPPAKLQAMRDTPTWMEEWGKVAVSYPHAWWRKQGSSGIASNRKKGSAVQAWWEASSGLDGDGDRATLAGFVDANGASVLNNLHKQGGDNAVLEYVKDEVSRLFDAPIESENAMTVTYKDWSKDSYVHVASSKHGANSASLALLPPHGRYTPETAYGASLLTEHAAGIFFAGTETAPCHGHMEGAIVAAQRAVSQVLEYLKKAG